MQKWQIENIKKKSSLLNGDDFLFYFIGTASRRWP